MDGRPSGDCPWSFTALCCLLQWFWHPASSSRKATPCSSGALPLSRERAVSCLLTARRCPLCRPRVVDMADHPQGLDLSRKQALLVVCSTQVWLIFSFSCFGCRRPPS